MKKLIATFVMGLFLALGVVGVSARDNAAGKNEMMPKQDKMMMKKTSHHRRHHRHHRRHHRHHHKAK